MAGEWARRKAGTLPKAAHTTRQSRHEEAEQVYRRQVDLDIDASRHVVRKRVKNKT